MNSKIAIVTGAGSGIGRHSSVALAKAGFSVVLAGRTEATLAETQGLIGAAAADAQSDVCITDVTNSKSVDNLFRTVTDKYGRLDLLFNNAGVGAPDVLIDELTDEQWQNCISTNLTGMFYCLRAAFRVMKTQDPQGGRIINNGSISAQTPRPNSIPYTATKHAVTGLTKSTSLDGRQFDIACGQIDIGNASTEMTARMATGAKQANGSTVTEPTMDVSNVANAVVHMASLPLDANILQMTVMANSMPLVGRG